MDFPREKLPAYLRRLHELVEVLLHEAELFILLRHGHEDEEDKRERRRRKERTVSSEVEKAGGGREGGREEEDGGGEEGERVWLGINRAGETLILEGQVNDRTR